MKFKKLLLIVPALLMIWFVVRHFITWNIWDAVRRDGIAYVQKYLDAGGEVDASRSIEWKSGDYELGYTLLMEASRHGAEGVAALLVNHGADVNGKTTYNRTPLLFAAEDGNTKIIQLLIDKGADVNCNWTIGTNIGSSAPTILSRAIFYGNLRAVKLLLNHGARITQDDINLAITLQRHDRIESARHRHHLIEILLKQRSK